MQNKQEKYFLQELNNINSCVVKPTRNQEYSSELDDFRIETRLWKTKKDQGI